MVSCGRKIEPQMKILHQNHAREMSKNFSFPNGDVIRGWNIRVIHFDGTQKPSTKHSTIEMENKFDETLRH